MSTVVQLTPNFALHEFTCHNGDVVPPELLANVTLLAKNLQVLHDYLSEKAGKKVSIQIVSGYRSPVYNKSINGAAGSLHMTAKGADIRVKGVSEEDVKAAIEHLIAAKLMKQGGVGIYETWIHYDVRGTKARWNNTVSGQRG